MAAKRLQEELELSEAQKKRRAQVQEAAQFYTEEDWDTIRAKLEANADLVKEIAGEDVSKKLLFSTEHKSEKLLLLTWHDSSAPTKESVCDFVTPRSLPQHDSSKSCKDFVCEFDTPSCMPHGMLTPPTDEFVIMYTHFVSQQATASHVMEEVMRQLSFEEIELDGEAGFGDVAVADAIPLADEFTC
ncbi:hypothetical protein Tco_0839388 [Tanacetum coccineum]|uniref:ADF-H domain-containing protein n=1 Tax=Tanacetum coccineum TaxID=301880 RepID=A0ABQ5AQG3_9ASTR